MKYDFLLNQQLKKLLLIKRYYCSNSTLIGYTEMSCIIKVIFKNQLKTCIVLKYFFTNLDKPFNLLLSIFGQKELNDID